MKNTALLIIDVQNELVEAGPFNIDKTLSNIQILTDVCRENGIEVIYSQHDEDEIEELKIFSYGWEIHSSICPKPGEKVIWKNYNSAFKNTELDEYLKSKDIQTLIIVGMQTEYCIDTTCRIAFEKGYKIISLHTLISVVLILFFDLFYFLPYPIVFKFSKYFI